MRRFAGLVAVLFLLPAIAALGACDAASSGPSQEEIKTAVIQRFRDDPYASVAHVENISKTNSVPEGKDTVTVMVHYDMVFDRSISDFADDVAEQGKKADNLDAVGKAARDALDVVKMKMLALKDGEFKVGDRRSISNEIRMVKSEKGWIYRPQPKAD